MATTTTTKPDPNAVTWNPDGTYNKGGKTYRKATMTPQQYAYSLEEKARSGGTLTPQEQSAYNNALKYSTNWSGRGTQSSNPQTPQTYDVEVLNYQGSTAAPTTTTPTTTTPVKPTTTTPTETPHQKAVRLAKEAAAADFKRLYGKAALDPKDPWGVGAEFNRLLNEALKKVPATDDDISKYVNTGNLFSQAISSETKEETNKLNQAYKAATPYGWETNYIADTADDPILQQILGQQAGDTLANLKRNLDRGVMSQGAYDYALSQLGYTPGSTNYGGLSSSAYQTLQDVGGGVLGGYREGLGDIAEEFNTDISNYTLGTQIDPKLFTKNLTTAAQGYLAPTNLEGDIRKALGSTQLFDPNKLISTAGGAVGPSNQPIPGSTPQGTGQVLPEDEDRSRPNSPEF